MKTSLKVLVTTVMIVGGLYLGTKLARIGAFESHSSSGVNLLFSVWMYLGVGLLVFLAVLKIQDMRTAERTGKRRSKLSWSVLVNGYFTFMMLGMTVLSLVLDLSLLVALTGILFLVFLSSLIKTINRSTRFESYFLKKWEAQRRRGPVNYVIRNSILLLVAQNFGVVIGSLLVHAPPFAFMQYTLAYLGFLLSLILVNIAVTIYLWNSNNARFKRLTENQIID